MRFNLIKILRCQRSNTWSIVNAGYTISIFILAIIIIIAMAFWGGVIDLILIILRVELVLYLIRAVKSWSHVIILILVLEFFRISGFLSCALIRVGGAGPLIVFLFAVVIVCEASIGISLIVALTRGRGDEIINV